MRRAGVALLHDGRVVDLPWHVQFDWHVDLRTLLKVHWLEDGLFRCLDGCEVKRLWLEREAA